MGYGGQCDCDLQGWGSPTLPLVAAISVGPVQGYESDNVRLVVFPRTHAEGPRQ